LFAVEGPKYIKCFKNVYFLKRFLVVQNIKLLKVTYSLSRSFLSDTHREKTSVWRKAIKCVDFIVLDKMAWEFKNKGLMREQRRIVEETKMTSILLGHQFGWCKINHKKVTFSVF